MIRRARLLLVSAMLTVTAGCFELETTIVLKADGSATVVQHVAMTEGMVKAARIMAEFDSDMQATLADVQDKFSAYDKSKKKALKKQGIKVVKRDAVIDEDTISLDWSVSMQDFTKADELKVMEGAASIDAGVVDNGDGTSTLRWSSQSPAEQKKEAKETDKPELTEAQQAKMQEAAMMMFGEASKMRMATTISVPGEVLSYSPKIGATVEGGTVTWLVDSSNMMELSSDKSAESGFQVTYRQKQ